MDDFLNSVESALVTFFNTGGDGDLTGTVNHVHRKLLLNPQKYTDDQLPAVAIYASGYIGDEEDRHNDGVRVYIEVTHRGADVDAIDNTVKEVVADIVNKLRAESPVLDNSGRGVNGNFDDVFVSNADVFPIDLKNNGLMFRGSIDAEVYFVT